MSVTVRDSDAVIDTDIDGKGSSEISEETDLDAESELLGAALLLDVDTVFDGAAEAEAVPEVVNEIDRETVIVADTVGLLE